MKKKNTFIIALFIPLTISFSIFFPITFLSFGLSSYGVIDDYDSFEYAPSSHSTIEYLNIKSDIGDVKIDYVNVPVSYLVKIELYINMAGFNLSRKNYSDFFFIDWQNTTSPVNLTMGIRSNIDKSELISLINNVSLVVYLRADIIFDINVTLIKGNVEINVPYMVSVNNIAVNTAEGDISFNFNHCILKGNILGYNLDGDFVFKVENIYCTKNIIWNLTNFNGRLDFQIHQTKELEANVTGMISTENLYLIYLDDNEEVEALFIFPNIDLNIIGDVIVGFDIILLNGGDKGYQLKSSKFPASNNYNLMFNNIITHKLNIINNQPY